MKDVTKTFIPSFELLNPRKHDFQNEQISLAKKTDDFILFCDSEGNQLLYNNGYARATFFRTTCIQCTVDGILTGYLI